ncbi:sensor histidine kinase [Siccirubricoccus deserti]
MRHVTSQPPQSPDPSNPRAAGLAALRDDPGDRAGHAAGADDFRPGAGESYPFMLFFVPVLLSACLFDHGSGLLATAASAVLVTWSNLSPAGTLSLDHATDTPMLVMFMAIGAAMSGMVETMHRAVARAQRAHAELVESNRRRDMLLHEFRHRTRNDLQSLSALLLLRARAATSEAAGEGLREAAGHARALARVHGWLARGAPADRDDPARVDTREFIEGLCRDLEVTQTGGLRPIGLRASAESYSLDTERAVHLGLVLNELVTNALKYGFPDERHGVISVRFTRSAEEFVLIVSDDGIGQAGADDEAAGSIRTSGTGLGTRLMHGLAAQLRGRFSRAAGEAGVGTIAQLRFPVVEPRRLQLDAPRLSPPAAA